MNDITNTIKEPTLEESVQIVMRQLPPVIRSYIAQEQYAPIVRELVTKYNLHIDQGGTLERETMLLLMGIETPTEFMNALTEDAAIDHAVVFQIVRDVNERIFLPLRAKMEMEEKPQSVVTSPAPAPAPVPVVNTPKLLEDHEEPSPQMRAQGASFIDFRRAPVPPGYAAPPANLPGAMPPPATTLPTPTPPPTAPQTQPPVPPLNPIPPPHAGKPYDVDPYREPVG